ncbi:sporulation protein, partial [Nocardia sp. NPDC059228]|uniref:sporulation protein n=1 Tax=Nocardia sp. NPDC059228 TaxID=3346777 RepID=UPI00369F5EEA
MRLIAASGLGHKQLARRVNELAERKGITTKYVHTSVLNWAERGMAPRHPVPSLIAEALGGQLGRAVTAEDIGMGTRTSSDPDIGLHFPRDPTDAVLGAADFWSDVDRRDVLGFAVSAYAMPVTRWLVQPADTGPAGAASGRRVGRTDITSLWKAVSQAQRWDSKYGGGDWRSSMVPECLRVDAAPLLLAAYSDEVGRGLFGATAELTRLAGWMAFDTGQQEAAQRYYIQALRLARAAADVPLGGYVLASMSLQATYRGFADEGVDLAQAALERNRGLATARTMSFFRLVEARAHAKAGDAAAAGAALKAAEGWLERSRAGDADPSWLGFYSYDRFAADAAECYRDLKAPRQMRRFTEQALSRPTEEFARSHGLRLVVSAV